MATITINKLIGGDINIITTGGSVKEKNPIFSYDGETITGLVEDTTINRVEVVDYDGKGMAFITTIKPGTSSGQNIVETYANILDWVNSGSQFEGYQYDIDCETITFENVTTITSIPASESEYTLIAPNCTSIDDELFQHYYYNATLILDNLETINNLNPGSWNASPNLKVYAPKLSEETKNALHNHTSTKSDLTSIYEDGWIKIISTYSSDK